MPEIDETERARRREKQRAAAKKREARIERWRRPLTSPSDRLHAWLNMLFVDHAIFRLVWPNFFKVTDRLWRSAQPMPHMLRRFARAGGRSVLTLRGGQTFGSLPLEIETCARLDLAFEAFVLRSRGLPTREEILAVPALFARLEAPVLVHCKSGADRAGLMSALYLILVEDRPLEEARKQLSLRYGHLRHAKTGVLDALFDAYEADHATNPVNFRDWVETRYDPAAIEAGFRATRFSSLIADRLLRRE